MRNLSETSDGYIEIDEDHQRSDYVTMGRILETSGYLDLEDFDDHVYYEIKSVQCSSKK